MSLTSTSPPGSSTQLASAGFTLIEAPCTPEAAPSICREAAAFDPWRDAMPPMRVVGDFRIPVVSAQARDFQAFHFDFGLPLDPQGPRDLARYTVLQPHDKARPEAVTRLVNLKRLLAQRTWPDEATLIRRFGDYGRTHGAWDAALGYTEGILGRLIEAADGREPALPSVSAEPGFLCGTEFADPDEETCFLARHGLDLARAETAVKLEPGGLLIFDNLQIAHARRGSRKTEELHQLVLGYRALGRRGQLQVRARILAAFRG